MHDKKLETTALVLTAEIYNRNKDLKADDLPSELRKHYWDIKEKTVLRPMNVTAMDLEELLDIHDPACTIL
jgi:hypothetical protein